MKHRKEMEDLDMFEMRLNAYVNYQIGAGADFLGFAADSCMFRFDDLFESGVSLLSEYSLICNHVLMSPTLNISLFICQKHIVADPNTLRYPSSV